MDFHASTSSSSLLHWLFSHDVTQEKRKTRDVSGLFLEPSSHLRNNKDLLPSYSSPQPESWQTEGDLQTSFLVEWQMTRSESWLLLQATPGLRLSVFMVIQTIGCNNNQMRRWSKTKQQRDVSHSKYEKKAKKTSEDVLCRVSVSTKSVSRRPLLEKYVQKGSTSKKRDVNFNCIPLPRKMPWTLWCTFKVCP